MNDIKATASIVIPTYHRPELLKSAVASAFDALPEHGEVVVTDDGDVEKTRSVLSGFDQSRLVISANPGAKGAGANRNNGVAAARGEIVFFLDDDDLVFPDYPNTVLQWIREHDDAVWGYSSTAEHDLGAGLALLMDDSPPIQQLGPSPTPRSLAGLGCGFWIKRASLQSAGGIQNDLQTNEDTDLCLTLLSRGHLPVYSARPGVSLYRGEDTSLTRNTDPKTRSACFKKILEVHSEFLREHPEIKQFVLSRYFKHAGRGGDFRSGMNTLYQSRSILGTTNNFVTFGANLLIGKARGFY